MTINAVSPNFQGEYTSRITSGVQRVITDPTDVNNREAAIGGTVAAGGVGGAAIVATRLKTMRTFAQAGTKYVSKLAQLKSQNTTILANLASKLSKFVKSSKATAWISKVIESSVCKKLIGLSALGITIAQLFSAGDMAVEAYNRYKD